MSPAPQKESNDKGFWDGGAPGHGTNRESSGRPDGFPGPRRRSRTGVRTDIEGFAAGPAGDEPEAT
jgi:hypothetical protein